jgi:hypothetical protein
MKKRITCTAALLAAAATAHAGPRVGLEMGQTLAGYRGAGARVDLGAIQLEGLVGGNLGSSTSDVAPLEAAARVFLPVVHRDDGWLGAMAGLEGARLPDQEGGGSTWSAEAGAHAEWFALPALSVGLDLGVVHASRGAYDVAGMHMDPTRSTTLGAGFAVGGTLTFWF